LCKDQSVKLSLDQRKQERRRLEDETNKDVVCTVNILPRKFLKIFEDCKIGEQEIRTVKYESKLVLFVKEETVLQGKIDRLIKIARYYGMEMNAEEKLVNENFKATIHHSD
jgi:hypothetical protein